MALRVVQGGEQYRERVWVDEQVFSGLEALENLVLLHNASSVAVFRALKGGPWDRVPAAAIFTSSFHRTISPNGSRFQRRNRRRRTPGTRQSFCEGLEWLGLKLDAMRNADMLGQGGRTSREESQFHAQVTPTVEGLMMAHLALRLHAGETPTSGPVTFSWLTPHLPFFYWRRPWVPCFSRLTLLTCWARP